MFYFSQEKIKFRGRNAITNRKLIISWSWNTSRDLIKSHKSLYFTQIIGPMAVLMSESIFSLSPLYYRSILKSRIFVVIEWEIFFERCVEIYHRVEKLFSALFFSLMIQTMSNLDSLWHAWHYMCKPGF